MLCGIELQIWLHSYDFGIAHGRANVCVAAEIAFTKLLIYIGRRVCAWARRSRCCLKLSCSLTTEFNGTTDTYCYIEFRTIYSSDKNAMLLRRFTTMAAYNVCVRSYLCVVVSCTAGGSKTISLLRFIFHHCSSAPFQFCQGRRPS